MDERSAEPPWVSAAKGFFEKLEYQRCFPDLQAKKGAHSDLHCGLLKVDRVERGRVSFFFTVKAPFTNHFGTFQGGAGASIAEEVSATCLKTVAGDKGFFLGELAVSYLSAAYLNAELEVTASILRHGRSVAVTMVEFRNKETNQLVYTAKCTFYSSRAVAKL
ncbi:uncharacterized protein [Aristolochia californica]|uniref:uncharacterized protein n=1 Tax=Aristolochia californica TaxID=171875 RepID=UPI0035DB945C